MKSEQPQTIINVNGNYIAQQNIDIHDNSNCNIYATEPQPVAQPTAPATGQPHPAADNNNELFCRITQKAYDMQQAQAVEHELRSAAISAPKLVQAIRTNEALGYLDTKNLSSTDLYNLLNEHFGLTFKQRNFAKYRAK